MYRISRDLGYAVRMWLDTNIQASSEWGSEYYAGYSISLPSGLFESVLDVGCRVATGAGLWDCQPFQHSASGFEYYVKTPRSESPANKDVLYWAVGVLS